MAFLQILWSGCDAARMHRGRSAVTISCVLTALVPYLVGAAISTALRRQAAEAISTGADLYVSGVRFGRTEAIPLAWQERIAQLPGVRRVTPRIVGDLRWGTRRERVVLVGIDLQEPGAWPAPAVGRWPRPRQPEVVVGAELAARLNLRVGARLPPFYRHPRGEKVVTVVGVLAPQAPLWTQRLALTDFAFAGEIYHQSNYASELLVWCGDGQANDVAAQLVRRSALEAALDDVSLKVVRREELAARYPTRLLHREGLFTLHLVLAWAAALLTVVVSSGLGTANRRQETGLLKALGWRTDELLLRGAAESLALALASVALAVLLAWVWLHWGNGAGMVGAFVSGADVLPSFEAPFVLWPQAVGIGLVVALAVVLLGTLGNIWRNASAPPTEALQA